MTDVVGWIMWAAILGLIVRNIRKDFGSLANFYKRVLSPIVLGLLFGTWMIVATWLIIR